MRVSTWTSESNCAYGNALRLSPSPFGRELGALRACGGVADGTVSSSTPCSVITHVARPRPSARPQTLRAHWCCKRLVTSGVRDGSVSARPAEGDKYKPLDLARLLSEVLADSLVLGIRGARFARPLDVPPRVRILVRVGTPVSAAILLSGPRRTAPCRWPDCATLPPPDAACVARRVVRRRGITVLNRRIAAATPQASSVQPLAAASPSTSPDTSAMIAAAASATPTIRLIVLASRCCAAPNRSSPPATAVSIPVQPLAPKIPKTLPSTGALPFGKFENLGKKCCLYRK